MPWWLILIAVILLLLVLGAMHPLRVRIEGRAADVLNLQLVLMPFGIFPIKIRIIDLKDTPYEQIAEKIQSKQSKKSRKSKKKKKKKQAPKNKGQTANKGKQNFAEEIPFSKSEILDLLKNVLGSLRIEALHLEANLAGDPYHSGIACGILWVFFGGGFAFFSHLVKKFTKKPIMNFGVDLNRSWSAYFKIQIMLRIGDWCRLAVKVLWILIKNKHQRKHKTSDNANNNDSQNKQMPNSEKQSAA